MFLTEAVQGKVDDDLRLGTALGDTRHPFRNDIENGIRRDIDDAGPAELISGLCQINGQTIQEWFTTADREPIRRFA
jgi:hypothetical protein